jgi:hypothetical protein
VGLNWRGLAAARLQEEEEEEEKGREMGGWREAEERAEGGAIAEPCCKPGESAVQLGPRRPRL